MKVFKITLYTILVSSLLFNSAGQGYALRPQASAISASKKDLDPIEALFKRPGPKSYELYSCIVEQLGLKGKVGVELGSSTCIFECGCLVHAGMKQMVMVDNRILPKSEEIEDNRIRLKMTDAKNLSFRKASFDLALFDGSLEEIAIGCKKFDVTPDKTFPFGKATPEEFKEAFIKPLSEARRVLRPNGYLVVYNEIDFFENNKAKTEIITRCLEKLSFTVTASVINTADNGSGPTLIIAKKPSGTSKVAEARSSRTRNTKSSSTGKNDFYTRLRRSNELERQEVHFDSVAERYDKYDFRKISYEWMSSVIEKLLRDLPETSTILDLGTGTGDVPLEITKRLPLKFIGLDISQNMLNVAEKRAKQERLAGKIRFIKGDIYNLQHQFENHSLHGATMKLALHHFKNAEQIMRGLKATIAKGGRIIVADFLSPEDEKSDKFFTNLNRLREPANYKCRTLSELIKLFNTAGVVNIKYETRIFTLVVEDWLSHFYRPEQTIKMVSNASDRVKREFNIRKSGTGKHLMDIVGIVIYGDIEKKQPQNGLDNEGGRAVIAGTQNTKAVAEDPRKALEASRNYKAIQTAA